MIITGMDQRNIMSVMDNLQTKLLVEVLRMVANHPNNRQILIDASHEVQKAGFKVTAVDAEVAARQFCTQFGYRVDPMMSLEKLAEEDAKKQKEAAAPPTPKHLVN